MRTRNPHDPWNDAENWYQFERNSIEQEAIGKAAEAPIIGISPLADAHEMLNATGHSYTDAAAQQAAQALTGLYDDFESRDARDLAETALRAAWEDGHLDFV